MSTSIQYPLLGTKKTDPCLTTYQQCSFKLTKVIKIINYVSGHIGSFTRNFHIGFDPDYELIKNKRPVSNKTPDNRIVKFVIAIKLEAKNEQFCLCFMSQNHVVVENKRVLPALVPSPGTWSPSSSWQRITRDRNTFNLYSPAIILI